MANKQGPVQHNEKEGTWTAHDSKGKKLGDFQDRASANAAHQASRRPRAAETRKPSGD